MLPGEPRDDDQDARSDPRAEIVRLEDDIEELAERLERCRKLFLVAKLAIVLAGIWLLALISGAISFDSVAMTGAIAAVIGGTVVFGSNASTARQTQDAIKASEALRAELVGRVELRTVEEADRTDRAG
jgi:hypothetical protein